MFAVHWSLESLLIAAVIIAAAAGIVIVAMRVFGVSIPQWAVHMFWIIVVAVVAVVAIRFLFSL